MSEPEQNTVTHSKPAPIVLGAVAFGKPKPTTRDHPLSSDESCDNLLKLFYERGGRELDTARVYQNGNCEGVLGRLDIAKKIRIATKYNPHLPGTPVQQLDESLAALQQESVPIFYLHMPATNIDLHRRATATRPTLDPKPSTDPRAEVVSIGGRNRRREGEAEAFAAAAASASASLKRRSAGAALATSLAPAGVRTSQSPSGTETS